MILFNFQNGGKWQSDCRVGWEKGSLMIALDQEGPRAILLGSIVSPILIFLQSHSQSHIVSVLFLFFTLLICHLKPIISLLLQSAFYEECIYLSVCYFVNTLFFLHWAYQSFMYNSTYLYNFLHRMCCTISFSSSFI